MRKTRKWLKAIRKSIKEKPRNLKHGMSKDRFYRIWVNINRRCHDKNGNRYHRYGSRGIKCEWKTFDSFMSDMYGLYLEHLNKHGYKKTQIDRIDNDRNYCKENCKWSTPKEQSNNKSNNVLLNFKGESMVVQEWADKTGLPYMTIYRRIYNGWSVERALTELINIKKRNKKYVNKS